MFWKQFGWLQPCFGQIEGCFLHRWKLKSKGSRSFYVAAPRYWNSLPDDIRDIKLNLNEFKKRLKTFLFKSAFLLE